MRYVVLNSHQRYSPLGGVVSSIGLHTVVTTLRLSRRTLLYGIQTCNFCNDWRCCFSGSSLHTGPTQQRHGPVGEPLQWLKDCGFKSQSGLQLSPPISYCTQGPKRLGSNPSLDYSFLPLSPTALRGQKGWVQIPVWTTAFFPHLPSLMAMTLMSSPWDEMKGWGPVCDRLAPVKNPTTEKPCLGHLLYNSHQC